MPVIKQKSSEKNIQEWQIEGVKKAIKSLNEGKGVKGEIAMGWFNSLGTNKELPMPNSL